jgi:adenylate kinase
MLYERMLELRKQFYHTPLGTAFPRPIFRVTVLFIEEHQSVERQLKRGIAIREQNRRLRDKNLPLLEERDTDASPEAGRKRYKIFRDHYSTLQTLKKHFPFTLIDASGTIEEVQQNIIKEFKYQSSLELSQETYDMVQRIPLVSDVIMHARGDLVARLDEYQYRHAALFEQVIQVVEREFVPVIRRHAIAGIAFVRTMDSIFQSDLAIEMVLDVLSERGYHVLSDMKQMAIPDTLDQETGKIISVIRTEYQFQVRFQHPEIRDIFNNQKAVKMQLQK